MISGGCGFGGRSAQGSTAAEILEIATCPLAENTHARGRAQLRPARPIDDSAGRSSAALRLPQAGQMSEVFLRSADVLQLPGTLRIPETVIGRHVGKLPVVETISVSGVVRLRWPDGRPRITVDSFVAGVYEACSSGL